MITNVKITTFLPKFWSIKQKVYQHLIIPPSKWKKTHKLDHESSINPELIIVVQEIIKQTWTREVSIQIEEFDFMSSLEINKKKKKSWLMLMLEAAQEFIDFKEAQLEDQ